MSGAARTQARLIAHLIDIAVECATLRKRFPPFKDVAEAIGYRQTTSVGDLIAVAVDHGLIKTNKPHPFFMVVSAPDASWSTLSLEAWRAQNTPKPRKCLSCSKKFIPRDKVIFRCDRCKGLDDWEFTHV